MAVNALAFADGPTRQAALDELGVEDVIGTHTAPLHGVQGVHGSGKVPLVAEGGEIVEQ